MNVGVRFYYKRSDGAETPGFTRELVAFEEMLKGGTLGNTEEREAKGVERSQVPDVLPALLQPQAG